ncbi:MAG TPA: efflux RND transporter periplasmic adaptor subunit [Steroidobacteraceae bacterium]|nr:efflux RND transporter periplasmic adaptor subunit [Steroidobacteraceae bacterium]
MKNSSEDPWNSGSGSGSTGPRPLMRDTARQDRLLERPAGWRRHWRWLLAAAVAVGLLAAGVMAFERFSGAEVSVDRSRLSIATVERGEFVRDVAADGQVVAADSPTLYAVTAGTVSLKVHAGDAVTRGQVLAVLDSPDLTAKLAQEEATLASMKSDWQRSQLDAQTKLRQLQDTYDQADVDRKTAQREAERSQKAYELGAYTELQALKAKDQLTKAQFAFQQAKADLDAQPAQNHFEIDSKKELYDRQQFLVADLRRQVAQLQVRSPVDGRVGQVEVDDRAAVAQDAALLTVVDLSSLEVEIKVPESEARDITPGMTGTFEGDGRQWQGIVRGVSPEVVNGEVSARLRFADAKPEGLRQSQRLSVRVLIDRRPNVLMVDRGSFVDQDPGYAYVVRDGIAERRPVRLGAQSVQKVEILDGLQVGDQVVVSGADNFNNAPRVIISQ